jgi:hypothetical protein
MKITLRIDHAHVAKVLSARRQLCVGETFRIKRKAADLPVFRTNTARSAS